MTTATLQGTIHVERSVVVDRPRSEVYRFWRDFTNLPAFLQHVQDVRMLEGGPLGGTFGV